MGRLVTALLFGHLLDLGLVWEQVLMYPTPKAYDSWSICTPMNTEVNDVKIHFSSILKPDICGKIQNKAYL